MIVIAIIILILFPFLKPQDFHIHLMIMVFLKEAKIKVNAVPLVTLEKNIQKSYLEEFLIMDMAAELLLLIE